MEDTCIVCAESLEFCAYGKCGHKDMCHRCSARLRFLGDDKTCPLCKEECEVVVVTKFQGEFTNTLPPETLDQLARTKKRTQQYHYLNSIKTYYDEQETYQDVRDLCSFQHPVLDLYEGEGYVPRFHGLRDLKNFIRDNFKLHFCDLCLKNRKAFVCEQVLYPRKKLERHYREGDKEGPLAETGFSGHPMCQWCRNRFYNEDMHYQHMERDHFHCNICRRINPRKYVYFDKYENLEEHYKSDHYLCPMQDCLEKKFVVFETEQELKRHLAQNHGDQLGMAKGDRRAAMTIPVEFNFSSSSSRRQQNQHGGVEFRYQNYNGQGQGQARYGNNRNLQDHQQLQEALRLSMLDVGDEGPTEFDIDDGFPALGASDQRLGGAWPHSGSSSSANLTEQDFPALPGQSKNAKKHARQKARREQEREQQKQQQNQQVSNNRVSSSRNLQEENFPSLPTSSSSSARTSTNQQKQWVQTNGKTTNSNNASSVTSNGMVAQQQPKAVTSSQPKQQTPQTRDFPSLGGKKAANQHLAVNSQWGAKPNVKAQSQPRVLLPPKPQPSQEEQFPTLGTQKQNQKVKLGKKVSSTPSNTSSSSSYSQMLQQEVRLSKNMNHLNDQLIGKIKNRLDDDLIEFFRQESADYIAHQIPYSEFHAKLAVLGVVDLVPELASQMHQADLRESLLDAHELMAQAVDQWNDLSEDTKYRIGSPEKLLQEVEVARRVHAWQCPECHMVNGSADLTCDDCGLKQTVARSMIIAAEGLKPRTPRPQQVVSRSHVSSQNAWKKPAVVGSQGGGRVQNQRVQGGSLSQRQQAIKNYLENPPR
eukprot:TRINITY_DN6392_c0_g1_i2.p1 TRINITY_DN6392_c0_g1~~TRINITY_DN6392_c0_g1_i2.p1  ORF type:complete len:830 (-),score=131.32 TRINITY_DN6392_c0_g1_i2:506-2950(-)